MGPVLIQEYFKIKGIIMNLIVKKIFITLTISFLVPTIIIGCANTDSQSNINNQKSPLVSKNKIAQAKEIEERKLLDQKEKELIAQRDADKKEARAKRVAEKEKARAKRIADKKEARAKRVAEKEKARAKKIADQKVARAKRVAEKEKARAEKAIKEEHLNSIRVVWYTEGDLYQHRLDKCINKLTFKTTHQAWSNAVGEVKRDIRKVVYTKLPDVTDVMITEYEYNEWTMHYTVIADAFVCPKRKKIITI